MPGDADSERDGNADRVAQLRDIAEDVRGDSSESEQLAAILYRVSDLYDPDEETTVPEIYRNVQNILEIKARGGLPERDWFLSLRESLACGATIVVLKYGGRVAENAIDVGAQAPSPRGRRYTHASRGSQAWPKAQGC